MRLIDTDFLALLPSFMRKDPYVRQLAAIMSGSTSQLGCEIAMVTKWDKIDFMPEEMLDELARELDISWYMYDADIERKRAIIKNSDIIHTIFGTREAVQKVLDMYFGTYNEATGKYESEATITEWFEPGFPLPKLSYFKDLDPNNTKTPNGNCYWFAITTPTMEMTPEDLNRCKWVVQKVKSERSHVAIFIIVPVESNDIVAEGKLTYLVNNKYICGERICGTGEHVGTVAPVDHTGGGFHNVSEGRDIVTLSGDCDPVDMTVTVTGDVPYTPTVTNGHYELRLGTGNYVVTGSKEGYDSSIEEVSVYSDTIHDITLETEEYYTISGKATYSHNLGDNRWELPEYGAIVQYCTIEFENTVTGKKTTAIADDHGLYSKTLLKGTYYVTPKPGSGFICGRWFDEHTFLKDCHPYRQDAIDNPDYPDHAEATAYFAAYPYEYDNETVTVELDEDKTQNLHSWIVPCFYIYVYDDRKDPETGQEIEPGIRGPIIFSGSAGNITLAYDSNEEVCMGRVKAGNYTLSTVENLTSLPLYWECYDSSGENPQWTSAMNVDYNTSWRYYDGWNYASVHTTMPEE